MSAPERRDPPQVGPVTPVVFPGVSRVQLASGLNVWSIERRRLPLANVLLVVPAGSAIDPAALPGLASLTADMLDEGAAGRSAIEIQEAFGRLGTALNTDAGSDAAILSVTVLRDNLRAACDLLFDCVARPTFADADFERIRTLRLNRLQHLRNSAGALADLAFQRQVYGSHPYGHPSFGVTDAIERMRLDDLASFHASAWRPESATLIVVGDADAIEVARVAEEASARWMPASSRGSGSAVERDPTDEGCATEDAAGTRVAPARPISPQVVVVDRPGAAQTELRLGHLAVARSTPDYHALVLLNAVLGGQFVSRINLNLRERKGYTYGAQTGFDFQHLAGSFVLQTSVQTDATADAVRESLDEIRAIRAERPPTDDEVAFCGASITRGYARHFEATGQLARALAQLNVYGLPDDTFDRFVPSILALQTRDLIGPAQAHLDPDALCIVAVGDREKIESGLASLGAGESVITTADGLLYGVMPFR